jgi:hypothetical protein
LPSRISTWPIERTQMRRPVAVVIGSCTSQGSPVRMQASVRRITSCASGEK